MSTNTLKDYFTFTKGERISVFILLGMLLLITAGPCYYKQKFSEPTVDSTLQRQLDAVLGNIPEDSSAVAKNEAQAVDTKTDAAQLFYFDPNTLDAEGFKKLGLRDKTINTLLNYRNKGGHFKTAEDIRKIYGLREDEANRLIPYVRIENDSQKNHDEIAYEQKDEKPKTEIKQVDINTATEEDFKALPGIGDVLSKRIIKFRSSIHGFKSVNDISKTYGLSDSTFQLILPYLTISEATNEQ